MNPVWPPSVPTKMTLATFNETPMYRTVVTEFDNDFESERAYSTLTDYHLSGSIIMSKAQLAEFDEFVKTDLEQKTKLFDGFTHPRTGVELNGVKLVTVGTFRQLTHTHFEIPVVVKYKR
jgi:hypothetical protein